MSWQTGDSDSDSGSLWGGLGKGLGHAFHDTGQAIGHSHGLSGMVKNLGHAGQEFGDVANTVSKPVQGDLDGVTGGIGKIKSGAGDGMAAADAAGGASYHKGLQELAAGGKGGDLQSVVKDFGGGAADVANGLFSGVTAATAPATKDKPSDVATVADGAGSVMDGGGHLLEHAGLGKIGHRVRHGAKPVSDAVTSSGTEVHDAAATAQPVVGADIQKATDGVAKADTDVESGHDKGGLINLAKGLASAGGEAGGVGNGLEGAGKGLLGAGTGGLGGVAKNGGKVLKGLFHGW